VQKQWAVDVANVAAKSMGLDPKVDRKQVLGLKQRVTRLLTASLLSQEIRDAGIGRERRDFKD
jgi:hypothetical protein